MPLKPNCLKRMENMFGLTKIEKFIDEKDSLSLEDISGRVKIDKNNSKININEFVSGIPIAFKGKLGNNGIFIVGDYLNYFPSLNINSNLDTPMDIEVNNNKNLILFISNLRYGISENENAINTMLIDFIQGNNNLNSKLKNISDKISRIVMAGSSVYVNDLVETLERDSYNNTNQYKIELSNIIKNYSQFDKFLNIICNYIPVDLMPSIESADGIYFPQKENSPCLFLDNLTNINAKTLNLVTNPYNFNIYDQKEKKYKVFLGTSGENINTISQYTNLDNPLDIMEKTLKWGHLAPLAPDTLRMYPYLENDPLILDKIPDVYFTSGKNELSFKNIDMDIEDVKKNILLLNLPDFSKCYKAVVYNINNGEINEITFEINQ